MLCPVSTNANPNANAAFGHGAGPRARGSRHSGSGGLADELENDDNDANDAVSLATSVTTGGKFREMLQDLPFDASGNACICKCCGSQASDDVP